MITALVLGAGSGIGLWALAVWLFPPRPALGRVLARSTTPPAPAPILAADDTGWAAKLGRPFIAPLGALGLPGERLGRDLAVIGRSVATHLAEKATLAVAGLVLPTLLHLLLSLAEVSLGIEVPIVAGLILAATGFVLPDLQARAEAAKMRAAFRHALSAYLDLVWITLAGGAGVDSALNDSVSIGRGWAFDQIRRALDAARLTRATPWAALRQLGEELDITELSELAASVSLAGTEGAKVRAVAYQQDRHAGGAGVDDGDLELRRKRIVEIFWRDVGSKAQSDALACCPGMRSDHNGVLGPEAQHVRDSGDEIALVVKLYTDWVALGRHDDSFDSAGIHD